MRESWRAIRSILDAALAADRGLTIASALLAIAGWIVVPLQALAIDARRLVVVKCVADAVLVEPGTGLLHGVAVFDAVDGDWHDHSHSIVPGGFDVTS